MSREQTARQTVVAYDIYAPVHWTNSLSASTIQPRFSLSRVKTSVLAPYSLVEGGRSAKDESGVYCPSNRSRIYYLRACSQEEPSSSVYDPGSKHRSRTSLYEDCNEINLTTPRRI